MRTLVTAGLAAALLGLTGCGGGGPKFAAVSGRVTMNGEPLPDVSVDFQPVAAGKDTDPGPGSTGRTDKDGRYILRSQLDPAQAGAVVGKHQVRVWAGEIDGADAASGRPRGKKPAAPPIPGRYHVQTTLTFDVPAGGTSEADFPLTSP